MPGLLISIHAAQEGCDGIFLSGSWSRSCISIHAAQEGCDGIFLSIHYQTIRFQSTQPTRAVTVYVFNTKRIPQISIHAAQEGCDETGYAHGYHEVISIHAAQEGCDRCQWYRYRRYADFNPRSPRGLWQKFMLKVLLLIKFQSTQPKRAVTLVLLIKINGLVFQSTQPKRAVTV